MTVPAASPRPHRSIAVELPAFNDWIEGLRRRAGDPFAPWPRTRGRPSSGGGTPLMRLLHLGEPVSFEGESPLLSRLAELDVVQPGEVVTPGRWEVTAFRGLITVRDRRADGPRRVFLGDDGLRFAATICDQRPRGVAVDVGCGSGIGTVALAQTCDAVIGIDVVPECRIATELSADLNGVGDTVTVDAMDFTTAPIRREVDCVAANLPGVPVPDDIDYPPAGFGGPDGLRLSRALMAAVPSWLRHRSALPADANDDVALILRLQSAGTPEEPFFVGDLRAAAGVLGWDVIVVIDSRATAAVRNALTTTYAAATNPNCEVSQLHRRIEQHARELGMTHYYSCSVVARRGGSGSVTVLETAVRDRLDTVLDITGNLPALGETIAAEYYRRLGRLHMGFWELGDWDAVVRPMRGLGPFVKALDAGATAAAAMQRLFPAGDLAGVAVQSSVNLLLETLVDLGVAAEAD